jgi:hypothetical protein
MAAALSLSVLSLLAGMASSAWGQPGIYSCTDAKGRRLTADRPILECLDREQQVRSATGRVSRTLPPSLTGAEREEQEARERKAAEERQRLAEEKRLQRALLARYPRQDVHEGERTKALKAPLDAIASAQKRIAELQEQRQAAETEAALPKTSAEARTRLKRQVEDIEQHVAAQNRFIATQEEEKKRITRRFDEELARLKPLWAERAATAAAPASQPLRR